MQYATHHPQANPNVKRSVLTRSVCVCVLIFKHVQIAHTLHLFSFPTRYSIKSRAKCNHLSFNVCVGVTRIQYKGKPSDIQISSNVTLQATPTV